VASSCIYDGRLIIGGRFNDVDHISGTRNIAAWNGASWDRLEYGVDYQPYNNGRVYALAQVAGDLIVGGHFNIAGGEPASHIARWDGAGWHAMGTGMSGRVRAVIEHDHQLIAGGSFSVAGGQDVGCIALWNGTDWQALPGGDMDSSVLALVAFNGVLIAGGSFERAGEVAARTLASWDGAEWSGVGLIGGAGLSSICLDLSSYGNRFVASGAFEVAGDQLVNNVAVWNGSGWDDVGGGTDDWVYAACEHDGDLIVGGAFDAAGGVAASGIARWDGEAWHSLGAGVVGGRVKALCVHDGLLYAGGTFSQAGGEPMHSVASWDGAEWSALGGGTNGTVSALASTPAGLVVGGNFTTAGAVDARHVALWDGAEWAALADGVPGAAMALVVDGDRLIAGGGLDEYEISASFVGEWDGEGWQYLGGWDGNQGGDVCDLGLGGDFLFAAGAFGHIGALDINTVAVWDGAAWSGLGTGIRGNGAKALHYASDGLYVGGLFWSSGPHLAANIARWWTGTVAVPHDSPSPVVAPVMLGHACPAPFTLTTRIDLHVTAPALADLSIFDPTGRHVSTLISGRLDTGRRHVTCRSIRVVSVNGAGHA